MKSKNITFSRRLADQHHYLEGIYIKPELQHSSHQVQLTLTQGACQTIFYFHVVPEGSIYSPQLADQHQEWALKYPDLLVEMSQFAQAIIDFYIQKEGHQRYLMEASSSMA